jgi:FkbM family methyltransferase
MGIRLHALAETILRVYPGLTFTIMEVGARPLGGKGELFHQLLEFFPGSRILAFELEESLCEELNAKAPVGIRYFSVALGRTEEQRLLYETVHPMCSSLYKPAEQLLSRYHNLHVAMLKAVHVVDTVSIDTFLDAQSISDLDFIKIDIQGAELDAFIGGSAALQKTVAIVSEVEFVPLYQKQPLFGDVCSFLAGQGLMFHKFLAMSGRTLQPIVINNNPNFATQQMWSDAMFIKHLDGVDGLPSEKLLKLGLLAFMYGSPDVAFYCFSLFDKQHGSSVRNAVLEQ